MFDAIAIHPIRGGNEAFKKCARRLIMQTILKSLDDRNLGLADNIHGSLNRHYLRMKYKRKLT